MIVALEKLRGAAAFGRPVGLSADEAMAIADHIRRLTQEARTPYQAYWRDRAQRAEAMLAGKPHDFNSTNQDQCP